MQFQLALRAGLPPLRSAQESRIQNDAWCVLPSAHEPGRGIGTLSPHEERVGREPERGALHSARLLLSPALSSFLRQEERETRAIALPVQGFNARDRVSGNSPLGGERESRATLLAVVAGYARRQNRAAFRLQPVWLAL